MLGGSQCAGVNVGRSTSLKHKQASASQDLDNCTVLNFIDKGLIVVSTDAACTKNMTPYNHRQ